MEQITEIITVFSTNLKREIKKQGYKITEFAPNFLDISVPTFTKKCKDGSFTLVEIAQIEQILKVSFDKLRTKIDGYKYVKPKDLSKLEPKKDNKKVSNHGSNELDYLNNIL